MSRLPPAVKHYSSPGQDRSYASIAMLARALASAAAGCVAMPMAAEEESHEQRTSVQCRGLEAEGARRPPTPWRPVSRGGPAIRCWG